MKTKFSKGKWEVAKGGRSVNIGNEGKIRQEAGLPEEELHANMRLVAAAPKLFDALEAITDELEHAYDSANEPGSEFEKVRLELVTEARAALELAAGRSK